MRISKRVREEAVEALLADSDAYRMAEDADIKDGYGAIDERAEWLRARALSALWRCYGWGEPISDDLLEAAALLRDGWNPGEPVVLLKGGR